MGRDEIDAILDPLNDDELLIAMPKIIKNLEAENQRLKKGIQEALQEGNTVSPTGESCQCCCRVAKILRKAV